MNQLQIKYRNATRTYQIPGKWNELSYSQLLQLAELIHQNRPYLDFAFRALMILILDGRTWRESWWLRILMYRSRWEVAPGPISRFLDRLFGHLPFDDFNEWLAFTDFLAHPNPAERDQNGLTRNIIPHIRVQKQLFICAHNPLDSLTFGQWIFLNNYLDQWRSEKDPVALCKLIAVLYNNNNPNLTAEQITRSAEILKHAPDNIKLAVAILADGITHAKVKANPDIFPKPKNPTSQPDRLAWVKLLRAKAGHIKDMDAVAQISFDTILFDIRETKKEVAKQRSKTRKR